MNAVETADPVQHEMFGKAPLLKAPPICRTIIVATKRKAAPAPQPAASTAQASAEEHSANPQAATHARFITQSKYADLERLARTPIVPLAWVRGIAPQITPEDVGERKSGRPKLNVRKTLGVGDLEVGIQYLQRRTRELQKLVRGTQASEEHTTKIVSAAIKDVIRRLSVNLPEENREAIHEVTRSIVA